MPSWRRRAKPRAAPKEAQANGDGGRRPWGHNARGKGTCALDDDNDHDDYDHHRQQRCYHVSPVCSGRQRTTLAFRFLFDDDDDIHDDDDDDNDDVDEDAYDYDYDDDDDDDDDDDTT